MPTNLHKEKKKQKRLYKLIKNHFPNAILDYKHPTMRFSKSGAKMEMDVWIPSINTGIEYQDDSHFSPKLYGEKAYKACLRRDEEKRQVAKNKGINLIEIPYMDWDGSKQKIDELVLSLKKKEKPNWLS
jgi:hypothetical protein